jgi:hypothetical protein
MFDIIESNFAYSFGVDYGAFADTYCLTFSNSLLLKNGKYASNVLYTYNQNIRPLINSNIKNNFVDSNIFYWMNMFNITPASREISNTYINSNIPTNTYNIQTLSSDTYHLFQDSTGNVYVNPLEGSVDIVVRINPGAYTIIPLKSSVRQTAQIETLPRPSFYLYPEWIAANADSIETNRDVFTSPGYSFAFPTGTDSNGIGSNISYPLAPALSNLGVITALSNSSLILTTLTILTTPCGSFFTFLTPPSDPTNLNAVYKYSVVVSVFPGTPVLTAGVINSSSNVFSDSMSVFIYHDQAAFYADVGPIGTTYGENPFFYKYKTVIPAGAGAQSITFSAFEEQQYYIVCRPTNTLTFAQIPFTIVPFISADPPKALFCNINFDPRLPSFNPYVSMQTNFYIAKVHDPDYIRLPIIDSNGYYYKTNQLSCNIGFLPSATTNPSQATINTLLLKPTIPLGYCSNVSDDMTDYIPIPNIFPPKAYDPLNAYLFRYVLDAYSYNPISRTYDIGLGSNAILNPNGTIYLGSNTIARRQKRIVHYAGSHYIFTKSNVFTEKNDLVQFNSTSIPGLRTPFGVLSNSRGVRQVGPCGFLFMPEEGTWLIERFTLLLQTSNTNVHFLAIYPTSYIDGISTKNASLNAAICICVQTSAVTFYNTPAPTGVGYGTYYTFSNVYTVQSNYIISGRTQNSIELITDTNSYYSAIAYSFSNPATMNNTSFTMNDFSNSTIQTIENLTGSCIPYPDLGLYVSPNFYDGSESPNSYSIILSSNSPFSIISDSHYINPNINPNFLYSNYYTSQYAQSSPIVNSHLHFLQPYPSPKEFQIYAK